MTDDDRAYECAAGALTSRPCLDLTPPWYRGHWRDWHRGHGCNLDDGRKPTERAP